MERAVSLSLSEIAQRVDGELDGDGDITITGCAGYDTATQGDLTFAENPRRLDDAERSDASAIITPASAARGRLPVIRSSNPRLAFARALALFERKMTAPLGFHPTVTLGEAVEFGKEISVGAHVTIGNNVCVGSRVTIFPLVFIGDDVEIGDDTIIYPNVTILRSTRVGARCILHAGVAIGTDGFGYIQTEGRHEKVPQIGRVVIEDDVEIGANTAIDRATTGVTRIGAGTKIDNLVQIAHNVEIGAGCIIVAQCGIAGSTVLEDGVVLAGQTGVKDHIRIGQGAIVGAKSGVVSNIPEKSVYWGHPARPQRQAMEVMAHLYKLPGLVERFKQLEQRVGKLEGQGEDDG